MAKQKCYVCNSITLMSSGVCAFCQKEIWQQKNYIVDLIELALLTRDKQWFDKLVQEKGTINT